MTDIGIINGSTGPNRLSPLVAAWVKELADARDTETYHLVDLKDYKLPVHDEPVPASMSEDYQTPRRGHGANACGHSTGSCSSLPNTTVAFRPR